MRTIRYRQRTVAAPVELSGVGLHTGEKSLVRLVPAPPGHGVRFVRTDLPGAPELTAADMDMKEDCAPRRTALVRRTAQAGGEVSIQTVEHVWAAVCGTGLDNVRIEVDGPEPPALDGSALPLAEALARVGVAEQDSPREALVIEEPIVVEQDEACIMALPARPEEMDGALTSVGYSLRYEGSSLATGAREFRLAQDVFAREVAPARTFCLARDVEELLAAGLGKGADYQNTLVIDGDRAVKTELRFPDEPVRHKILDIVGDLGLLGAPVAGRIEGFRSGHRLNRRLVAEVIKRAPKRPQEELFREPVMGVREVERLLPHRYPFLLIDRVLELEPEKRVLAAKHVSANEEFFCGHFPGNPVMPGVLQAEALAQAAGVLLSRYVRVGERMAALVGLNGVKFRRPVVPGDRLLLEVHVKKIRSRLAICRGTARVAGETVAEAELLFSLIPVRSVKP